MREERVVKATQREIVAPSSAHLLTQVVDHIGPDQVHHGSAGKHAVFHRFALGGPWQRGPDQDRRAAEDAHGAERRDQRVDFDLGHDDAVE